MRALAGGIAAAIISLFLVPAVAAAPQQGWELTVYATVLEGNHQGGAPISVFRCLNNDPSQGSDPSFPLGTHPQEFVELSSFAQQGSGRFMNGTVLGGFHYTGPGTGCGSLNDVPITASGEPAIPWQTAAGGADVFPALNTWVRITACGNASLQTVCPLITSIKWQVTDRGVSGNHLDLYIGDENPADTFFSPDATVDTAPATGPSERIAGPGRIDTSVVTSQERFGGGTAKAVVLARSDDFADALAGTPLAVAKVGPLLITPPFGLDARTDMEIRRVLPAGGPVYVLGGTAAMSPATVQALTAEGYAVTRLAGANRFGTAVAVANAVGTPSTVMLATGTVAADALVAGAAAAHTGGVVMLTNGTMMPPETAAYLGQHQSAPVWALGGPASAADPAAKSLVGTDRYETSTLVAHQFFTSPSVMGAASGSAFADALSGGAAMGNLGGPLLLVDSPLPTSVHDYLASNKNSIGKIDVFGGIAVVPPDVLASIDTAAS